MRELLLCFLVVVICVTGCSKKKEVLDPCTYDPCATVAPATEIQSVQTYLTSKGLTATQHCSGVFYIIDAPGSGAAPNVCSYINTNYVGRLTNGNGFDSGMFRAPIQLGGLIRGWANTLPLIKQGGRIRMFLPPSMGYGNQAAGTIPPNSILIFDVELTFVQ